MSDALEIKVEIADITEVSVDVLALKYARSFHGADLAVAKRMLEAGVAVDELEPEVGERRMLQARGRLGARNVLMVGTPSLGQFRYAAIRDFSSGILRFLAKEAPETTSLAMTIHGPGYGLDEGEALLSQVSGYLDAWQEGLLPKGLTRVVVVEKREARAFRLWQALERQLGKRADVERIGEWALRVSRPKLSRGEAAPSEPAPSEPVLTAPPPPSLVGAASEAKPHAFVAMPFTRPMDDVYYFGIEQPVHALGMLCERVDQASFSGHILDQIRERIDTAAVVIADLTGANPNVYLEVGYAWGRNRPTILLVQNVGDLRFDVQSQRCLVYERIIDLTRLLTNELQRFQSRGLIRLP